MSTQYIFMLQITVHDEAALKEAAEDRANGEWDQVDEWRKFPQGAQDDLNMMILPCPPSIPGCEIGKVFTFPVDATNDMARKMMAFAKMCLEKSTKKVNH